VTGSGSVIASCASGVDCQDTGAFDWGWLAIPAVVLCAVVIAAIVWFAGRGGRG
jgi:hypothetical protein